MITKTQILAREQRFTLIAGIAAVAGVALVIGTFGSSAAGVRAAAGLAERLIEVDGERSKVVLTSIGQLIGWSLLAIPLAFMFKAAAARSPRVRSGLIGVVIAAPIFLGVGGLLSAGSVLQAATDFKALPDTEISSCVDEKKSEATTEKADKAESKPDAGKAVDAKGADGQGADTKGGDVGKGTDADGTGSDGLTAAEIKEFAVECADDKARDIRTEVGLAPLETGVGLAGLLGFTIGVVYVSLWSMRTGLLTRFWGSLGLALGAVFVFFTLFTLIWFIYIGLLLAGWVPGGRPPAWAAGEAVEPPRGGGGLFGGGPGSRGGPGGPPGSSGPDDGPVDQRGEPIEGDVIDGTAESLPSGEEEGPLEAPEPGSAEERPDQSGKSPPARRKRKRRNG